MTQGIQAHLMAQGIRAHQMEASPQSPAPAKTHHGPSSPSPRRPSTAESPPSHVEEAWCCLHLDQLESCVSALVRPTATATETALRSLEVAFVTDRRSGRGQGHG